MFTIPEMFVLICISVIIIALVICCAIPKLEGWIYIVKKVNEFPGRKGYPIIGNTIEFLGAPDTVFKELRKNIEEYTDIGAFRSWLFVFPVIWLHEPQDLELLLGSVENNEKAVLYNSLRPWLGNGLLTNSGQQWHSRRKLLTPTFHFSILQNFLNIFTRESRQIAKIIEDHLNEVIDIKPMIFDFTLDSICETSMGVRLSHMRDTNDYRNSVHQFGKIAFERITKAWRLVEFIFYFTSDYWKQKKVVEVLHKFSKGVIEKRKIDFDRYSDSDVDQTGTASRKQMALLDMLLLAQKRGEDIDDDGIREEVDTFMFEGHDTTSICISFTLLLLANNRICQDKISEEIISIFGNDDRKPTHIELQELKYMERCIKESLRLLPSVPLIARRVGEDIPTHNGHIIPKGCTAIACIYDMHRRADLYSEPLKFNPDRFLKENCVGRHPYAYIPFSAGPRNCIGQKFAMMEIKCVLTEILRHFIIEPVDSIEDISCNVDIVLRAKDPIRVKFVRRG